MKQLIEVTRKLGANRGALRLWIEGQFLLDCGLTRGMKWEMAVSSSAIVIVACETGTRKVAGTEERPIIDINSTKLLKVLGATGDTVTLQGYPAVHSILITKA
jgi:hypothetical protein